MKLHPFVGIFCFNEEYNVCESTMGPCSGDTPRMHEIYID